MSGWSGAGQGAAYGSILGPWGTALGAGVGAGIDSATSGGGNPVPRVSTGDPLQDPEAQMRIQQMQQAQQAKGSAADILTGGSTLNPSPGPSSRQILLGN